jgi:hypothetical protein
MMNESGLRGHVGEGSVTIVLEKMRSGFLARRKALQPPSIHQKNIKPAIIVIVVKSDSTASGFEQIFIFVFAAVDGLSIQTCRASDIDERRSERIGWLFRVLVGCQPAQPRNEPENAFQRQDKRGTAERFQKPAA